MLISAFGSERATCKIWKKKTLSEKKEVRKFGDVCKDVNKHLRIQKGQPKNMKKAEDSLLGEKGAITGMWRCLVGWAGWQVGKSTAVVSHTRRFGKVGDWREALLRWTLNLQNGRSVENGEGGWGRVVPHIRPHRALVDLFLDPEDQALCCRRTSILSILACLCATETVEWLF